MIWDKETDEEFSQIIQNICEKSTTPLKNGVSLKEIMGGIEYESNVIKTISGFYSSFEEYAKYEKIKPLDEVLIETEENRFVLLPVEQQVLKLVMLLKRIVNVKMKIGKNCNLQNHLTHITRFRKTYNQSFV